MPKKLEEHLNEELKTNPKYKNLSQERKDAIKYSVLRKSGASIDPEIKIISPAGIQGDDPYQAPIDTKDEDNLKEELFRFAMSVIL